MSRMYALTIIATVSFATLPATASDYSVHAKSGRPTGLIAFSMNEEYCQYIPGDVPVIKLQPAHGRVEMARMTRKNSTRSNPCFGTDGVATVAVYQSALGYAGPDTVALAIQHYDRMGRAVDRILTFDVIVDP